MAEQESGGELRRKLEEQIELNKGLTGQLAVTEAEKHPFVTAQDLADIPYDQLNAKAVELQTERHSQRAEVVKDVLRTQGVPDDELDSRVETLMSGEQVASAPNAPDPGWGRLGETGGVGTPAAVVDTDNLHGRDAIAAGLAQLENSRKR